jgi:hypothetical protein
MNPHLTDGELRAALDAELTLARAAHLEACPECQARQGSIAQEQTRIQARLAFLAEGQQAAPSVESAWARFPLPPSNSKKEISMFKKMFAFPVVRFGLVAVLALALVLAIPSTRAMASELLNLFRVQQVAVLPIDTAGLEALTGNEALGNQLSELMSSSTTVTKEPAEPLTVADGAEASAAAGFAVRLPADLTPASIVVSDSAGFTLTLDRAKTQAFIDEAGRSDLALPETIDGADIVVNIPAAVNVTFGTCPNPEDAEEFGENYERLSKEYADCLVFGQISSPTVSAPAGVDVAALAQLALEFSGMSTEEAAALADTVDWTSTLVVPMPRNSGTYTDVSVDGVTGSLIQSDSEIAPQYVLLWVKNGMVYFVSGSGADASAAFALVNSLP